MPRMPRCANGDVYRGAKQYNDDYCDCDDGSDEPDTAACGLPQSMACALTTIVA
jgi:hypothetical protein